LDEFDDDDDDDDLIEPSRAGANQQQEQQQKRAEAERQAMNVVTNGRWGRPGTGAAAGLLARPLNSPTMGGSTGPRSTNDDDGVD
jgi:palmitoyltransferase